MRGNHLLPIIIPSIAKSLILVYKLLFWIRFLPGRLSTGAEAAMIVKAPLDRPETPRPDIALPIINIGDDFAVPHIKEPSSNRPKKARNVI